MIQNHEMSQEQPKPDVQEIRQINTDGIFYTGKEVEFTEETIKQVVSGYYKVAERSLTNQGPQSIRIEQEELLSCLEDTETIYTTINIDGEIVPFPLFVPIRNMPGSFDESFHEERLGIKKDQDDFNGIFFFAGSKELISQIDSFDKVTLGTLKSVIVEYEDRDVDFYEELKEKLVKSGIVCREESYVDDKNGSSATLHHYSGRVSIRHNLYDEDTLDESKGNTGLSEVFSREVESGNIQLHPTFGASILRPNEFAENEELQDMLWVFCEQQFTKLIEDFPIIQEPTKEDFIAMLSDPGVINAVYYHEGLPVTSCVFVENIENCDWLSSSYFKNKFNDESMGYFPYLATDDRFTSNGYASQVMKLINELIYKSKKPFNVTFECTNVSNDIVPFLVSAAVESDERLEIDLENTCNYNIRALLA